MIARGSLRRSVQAMLHAFHVQHYPFLSLIHNGRSQYYTVVTEEDLKKLGDNVGAATHRLVFRGTEKELVSFCTTDQLNLLNGAPHDALKTPD